MRKISRMLLTASLVAASISTASTGGYLALPEPQQDAEEVTEVSPEKRKLLEELQKISDHDSTIERSWNVLTRRLKEDLTKVYLRQLSKNSTLSDDEKMQAVKTMVDNIIKNFSEHFKSEFWSVNKEVFISAYAKFYTADEIKQLNEFYKSDTAKKSTKKMPQMIKNLIRDLRTKVDPKIEKCFKERLQELKNESSEKTPTI